MLGGPPPTPPEMDQRFLSTSLRRRAPRTWLPQRGLPTADAPPTRQPFSPPLAAVAGPLAPAGPSPAAAASRAAGYSCGNPIPPADDLPGIFDEVIYDFSEDMYYPGTPQILADLGVGPAILIELRWEDVVIETYNNVGIPNWAN